MRVQVRLPPAIWEGLCKLAEAEHRPPQYEAEWLLWEAIGQSTARLSTTTHTRGLREPENPHEATPHAEEDLVPAR